MSGYGLAVQQGVQAGATLMMGANSPEAIAAYNNMYASKVARYNAQDAQVAAERNISAVLRDNMVMDQHIQLQQNTVEAQIRSQAAWAGAEGGSVDAVVYDTQSAEMRRMGVEQKRTEQLVETQSIQVGNAASTLNAIQEPTQPSLGISLLAAFTQYSSDDWKDVGTLARGTPTPQTPSSNAGGTGLPMNFNMDNVYV